MAHKVLVIGGSGYVGQHLVQMLKGEHDLTWTFLNNPRPNTDGGIQLDIRSASSVHALIESLQPDFIFHLAYSQQDLDGCIVTGTRNIVDAWAAQQSGRLIYLSTDAVYDGENAPYSEKETPRPIYPYGQAKREAELQVLANSGQVVRTSIVYGFAPPDPRTAAVLRGTETGHFPHDYFSDEIRSPIFVQDLCSALIELMSDGLVSQSILHVAGPEALNRYDIALKIARSVGSADSVPIGTRSDHGHARPRDVTLQTRLAQSTLKTPLRNMDEVIRACRGNRSDIPFTGYC